MGRCHVWHGALIADRDRAVIVSGSLILDPYQGEYISHLDCLDNAESSLAALTR